MTAKASAGTGHQTPEPSAPAVPGPTSPRGVGRDGRDTASGGAHVAAWGIGGVASLAASASLVLEVLNARGGHALGASFPAALVTPLAISAVGALAVRHHPRNAAAWLLGVSGTTILMGLLASQYATYGLLVAPGVPAARLSAWVQSWLVQTSAWLFPLLLLLFPTGRLPSPRWRPVAAAMLAAMGVAFAADALRPGRVESKSFELLPVDNPFGIPSAGELLDAVNAASRAAYALAALLAVASLVVRYRRCGGKERLQLEWVGFGALVLGASVVVFIVIGAVGPVNRNTRLLATLVLLAGALAVAVAVGVAMVRHQLFDVDLLINRTVVYLTMSALVAILYVAAVTVLGTRLGGSGLGPSLLATGVVAVVFQPARERVQRAVNRMMYGERGDPYAVLARLGRSLESAVAPDTVLPDVVRTIAETLALPYVAIDVGDAGQARVASHSRAPDSLHVIPLTFHGEDVGRLLLGPRSADEPFSPAEQRLLADLARQVGVAVHAVRVTLDLRRSRERVVSAREEERRRIGRDLHDGLGPALAGVTLGLQAARNVVRAEPQTAESLLDGLIGDTQAAVADVKRLSSALHRPALNRLSLRPVLDEQIRKLAARADLHVVFDVPEPLPPLPAAVEVAVYRVALEAVTNVVRHARARTCSVAISLTDAVQLEVTDDGVGMPPDARPGVGLSSMRERAEELAGSCVVGPGAAGGTRVHARFPVASL